MINVEEFKNKPINIKILEPGERAPQLLTLQEIIVENIKGNLYSYNDIKTKFGTKYRNIVNTCRTLERRGVLTRLVIDGTLYVGLTSDVRELVKNK